MSYRIVEAWRFGWNWWYRSVVLFLLLIIFVVLLIFLLLYGLLLLPLYFIPILIFLLMFGDIIFLLLLCLCFVDVNIINIFIIIFLLLLLIILELLNLFIIHACDFDIIKINLLKINLSSCQFLFLDWILVPFPFWWLFASLWVSLVVVSSELWSLFYRVQAGKAVGVLIVSGSAQMDRSKEFLLLYVCSLVFLMSLYISSKLFSEMLWVL